ncbi:hypothetical protein A7Q09_04805 [Methylacidiphilum sp. Yel]|nr:hypothetical protein A7Q09_04805 [Methylacidiphilum sp. Yel]
MFAGGSSRRTGECFLEFAALQSEDHAGQRKRPEGSDRIRKPVANLPEGRWAAMLALQVFVRTEVRK